MFVNTQRGSGGGAGVRLAAYAAGPVIRCLKPRKTGNGTSNLSPVSSTSKEKRFIASRGSPQCPAAKARRNRGVPSPGDMASTTAGR